MGPLDFGVVGVYVVALLAMSLYFNRRQESQKDYYAGGRCMPQLSWLWWNVAGTVVSLVTGLAVAAAFPQDVSPVELEPAQKPRVNWPVRYAIVFAYFLGIIWFCSWVQEAAVSV